MADKLSQSLLFKSAEANSLLKNCFFMKEKEKFPQFFLSTHTVNKYFLKMRLQKGEIDNLGGKAVMNRNSIFKHFLF